MLANRDPFALRNLAAQLVGANKPVNHGLAQVLKTQASPAFMEAPTQPAQPQESRTYFTPQVDRGNPQDIGQAVGLLAQDAGDIIMQRRRHEADQQRKQEIGRVLQESGADPALVKLAQVMPEANQAILAKLLKGEEPETFSQPQAVVGQDGKQVLVQIGNKGTVRPVDGYSPTTKTDPWGDAKVVGGNIVRPDGTVVYRGPDKPTTPKRQWAYNTETRKPEYVDENQLASAPAGLYLDKAPETGGGPFAGTSMDAQANNILLTGDPSSPTYAAAYAHLSQPRMTYDESSGQMVTIRPDMSAFRSPVKMPQPNLPNTETAAMPEPNVDTSGVTPMPQPNLTGGVTVESVPGVIPKLSKDQSDAATYADRMQNSHRILNELDSVGADVVGTVTGSEYFPNVLKSSERQKMEQAQRDFVNALLRRQSGAVISPEEFANAAQQYFPQPGDSPDVIAQKKANREADIQGLVRAAGPAYQKPVPIPGLPDVTEDDIQYTMKKHGVSRDEVIKRLTTPDASNGTQVR